MKQASISIKKTTAQPRSTVWRITARPLPASGGLLPQGCVGGDAPVRRSQTAVDKQG